MHYLTYFVPILALAGLCAAWMGVQLMAKRIGTKNHIDQGGGCCGACSGKACKLEDARTQG